MENNSRSQILQDSRIVFPPDAFWWLPTVGFVAGALLIFFVLMAVLAVGWGAWQHLDLYATARAVAGPPGVAIQSIAEIVIVVYIVLLLPPVSKTSLSGIGFRKISGAQLGAIAIAAIAMFLVVTPLASILETVLHFKTPEQAIAMFTRTGGWAKIAFAFFGIVVAPAFEEAVFRLVLFNAMRRWWGFWPGAIVSSALFGLAHAQPPVTPAMFACISFPLAVGGIILCMVYAKTNNAWASMITHGAFNAFSLILLLLFPQLAK